MPNVAEEPSALKEADDPGAAGVMAKEATGAWSGVTAIPTGLSKPERVVVTVSLAMSITLTVLSAPFET